MIAFRMMNSAKKGFVFNAIVLVALQIVMISIAYFFEKHVIFMAALDVLLSSYLMIRMYLFLSQYSTWNNIYVSIKKKEDGKQ